MPTGPAVEVAKLYPAFDSAVRLEEAMIDQIQRPATYPNPGLHAEVWHSQWHVAYVITRHEKSVAQELRRRSIESFVPVYHAVHYWNKRRAEVELPLFPSYVFVRMTSKDRLCVLQVPAVVHLVMFNGLLASLPEEEIEALRAAVRLRHAQPHPYYSVGDRVRIRAGPLKGLEGTLVKQQNSSRLIVSVNFIRKSVSVELGPDDLEGLL